MTIENKKPCSLVLVKNNRRLTGTAAQLAHISECGGWDAFLHRVASQVLADFSQSYNESVRQPKLKVVSDTENNRGDDNG